MFQGSYYCSASPANFQANFMIVQDRRHGVRCRGFWALPVHSSSFVMREELYDNSEYIRTPIDPQKMTGVNIIPATMILVTAKTPNTFMRAERTYRRG